MDQVPLFSSGLELANLVVSSDLLRLSWDKVSALYTEIDINGGQSLPFSLRWKAYQESKCNIIAFVTSSPRTKYHLEEESDLVSSTVLKESFPLFEFLCTKDNPSFSIHKSAIDLFVSHQNELSQVKNQYGKSSSLIVTGYSLGASVAVLFTLWLLESINGRAEKRPLCITFGSPLIGDSGLQEAILKYPSWNSCFLNIAANKDPIPRLFIRHPARCYEPFGIYLLCSELGCTCTEVPEVISELLMVMGGENANNTVSNEETMIDYGGIVEKLKSMIKIKGVSLGEFIRDSLGAGTILQLEAIGVPRSQLQQQNTELSNLIRNLERREQAYMLNKNVFDPTKKLNWVKVKMTYLEWYKKVKQDEKIGYYDSFKKQFSRSESEIVRCKKVLTKYWKEIIAEVEKKPQKEEAPFRTRWLYAGTNYRRMVEPLEIAEYYKGNGRNYLSNGRSQHYIRLEQWLEEAGKPTDVHISSKKQNVATILTEDSCFWAHVEEALICCRLLNNAQVSAIERDSSKTNLNNFEEYVMDQIKNYAVSPEIFLKGSSFMEWWQEYDKIMGNSHNSPFTDFMRNSANYHQYEIGRLTPN